MYLLPTQIQGSLRLHWAFPGATYVFMASQLTLIPSASSTLLCGAVSGSRDNTCIFAYYHNLLFLFLLWNHGVVLGLCNSWGFRLQESSKVLFGGGQGAHKDYFSAVFTVLEQCKKFTNNRQWPWGKRKPAKMKGVHSVSPEHSRKSGTPVS